MTRTDDGALVVVDLSNLCRDRALLAPGVVADLSVFNRFVAALETGPIEFRSVQLVADRSLPPLLDADGRRRLRSLEHGGVLEYSSLADERLLELAFGSDAEPNTLIASQDYFDDFRRIFPGIQGCTDRFIGWGPAADGTLAIYWRDMEVHTHRRLSRKEEAGEFGARRLNRESIVRRAAATEFRCDNRNCLIAQLWPDRLPELPRYDDHSDRFVCPSCESPLTVGPERPSATQLIVFLHDTEQFRMLLVDGERIVIGRANASGCIGLETRLPTGAADAVSRSHAAFSLVDGRVVVEELKSRNGTVIRSSDGSDEVRLEPGVRHTVGRRDTVVLPSGITIELSGRMVPLDDDSALDDVPGDAAADSRATRILSTRR